MYEFLYEKNPSPKTVQRTYEAIQRVRDKIIADHGTSESYWTGKVDGLTELIDEMVAFEQDILDNKKRSAPGIFKKG